MPVIQVLLVECETEYKKTFRCHVKSSSKCKFQSWSASSSMHWFYWRKVRLQCAAPKTEWKNDPSKLCTLFARHISLTSCNITNPPGLCAHPVLISFQSPPKLNIWNLCFSVFRSKSLEFITCQYPWISVSFYFPMSSKDILFSVSLPPFQLPTLPSSTRPDS